MKKQKSSLQKNRTNIVCSVNHFLLFDKSTVLNFPLSSICLISSAGLSLKLKKLNSKDSDKKITPLYSLCCKGEWYDNYFAKIL